MSPPDPGWDEEERALLDSAALDTPTPGAEARTLAALGVGGAALGGTVVAGSAKAAAASAGKSVGIGKLLTVLVIGGSVAGGTAFQFRAQLLGENGQNAAGARTTPSKPAAPKVVAAAAPQAPPSTGLDSSAAAAALPELPEVAPSSAKAPAAVAATRTEPDIAAEIAALDRARSASEHGDYGGALRELDQYDHHFKRGRLRPEALLLRIQTMISKGDTAGAKTLGARFLAHYPQSPLAPRIQKLLGASP